jgi:hypothetical protein
MFSFLEQLIAAIWNRLRQGDKERDEVRGALRLGFRIVDGQLTGRELTLTNQRRTTHLAVLGKTGTGKSSFLKFLAEQDIASGRGFVYFDLHGDTAPFLLGKIAEQERRLGRDLSDKLIVIDPADPLVSVGFNPLESDSSDFLRIVDFTAVLKQRWSLDHFGARTEELLRNSLYALAANGHTLLELSPFLTNARLRAACLKNVRNPEISDYFLSRFDPTSDAMKAVFREPILNKTSAFTADPRFRHIVGQEKSTFSVTEAMDRGQWIIVNLAKGKLGEQALTLGSLLFSVIKNSLFSREKRSLFTLYCDEIQNFVAYDNGVETVLSEARKFGVSVVSANQFLDQYPVEMRSAILSVGTHAFFQLSSTDAQHIAQVLDGGRPLAERLKNLAQRHAIAKSGADRWTELLVPTVHEPHSDFIGLLNRSRFRWGKVRAQIEREIAERQSVVSREESEVPDAWE